RAAVSVFVVEDGERGIAVRSLVESWTRSGILEESLWLTPSDVTASSAGPPMVRASRVSADGVEQVDLFEQIGRFRLDLVRVVVAHLLVHEVHAEVDVLTAAGRQ